MWACGARKGRKYRPQNPAGLDLQRVYGASPVRLYDATVWRAYSVPSARLLPRARLRRAFDTPPAHLRRAFGAPRFRFRRAFSATKSDIYYTIFMFTTAVRWVRPWRSPRYAVALRYPLPIDLVDQNPEPIP